MAHLGAGPLGYRDWQRLVNWDGPALFNATAITKGEVKSAAIDVSRYAYLSGRIGTSIFVAELKLEWYADEALGQLVGERIVWLHPEISGTTGFRTPNLGPWLRVRLRPASEAENWRPSVLLSGSNRVTPVDITPQQGTVLDDEHAFAGAETRERFPRFYYAGPVQVLLFNKGAGTAFMDIEAYEGLAAFNRVDRIVAAAETLVVQRMVCPMTAWFASINSGGASTIELRMTPFTSGSS